MKALSRPCESAVHDCAQISSEGDCSSGCVTCHTKTIAPDDDTLAERDDDTLAERDDDTLLAGRDAEIECPSKGTS